MAYQLFKPTSRGSGVTQLLIDRDTKLTPAFKAFLEKAGVKIKLTPRSPNCNAIGERWVRTLRRELLDRMIFFGDTKPRSAVKEFVARYHQERPHQALDNKLLEPGVEVDRASGNVKRRDRLDGILRYYHRAVA